MELYQSNHETAGNREAGGFENSTVYGAFTLPDTDTETETDKKWVV